MAVVTQLIWMLLDCDTKTIVKITENIRKNDEYLKNDHQWRKPTQLFGYSGRKATQLFEPQLFALFEQSRELDTIQSPNQYILYLLQEIGRYRLIGAIMERNLYSKRIAEERKYNIECLQRNIP